MHKQTIDALFVTNQNTDFEKIRRIRSEKKLGIFLFITTHGLFRTEQEKLSRIFPGSYFLRFSDFITDQEMEDCDIKATARLSSQMQREEVRRDYNRFFMELSLYYKNKLVMDKVYAKHNIRYIYYSCGLGISEMVWKRSGGIALSHAVPRFILSNIKNIHRLARAASQLFRRHQISLIRHENQFFIFFSSIKRLNIETSVESLRFFPLRHLARCFPRHSYPDFVNAFLDEYIGEERDVIISTALHNYSYELSLLKRPLQIFVDGFHPANYPRTYIDSFISGDFVNRTMFDELWFRSHGKKTIKPYPFLKKEIFKLVDPNKTSIRYVILLLNHAGDWTALINRSDTDNLIQAFADTAEKLKNLEFVIRPHPTMVHPSHEGVHSIDRIRDFIKDCKLDNLAVSNGTLEEDIATGDLFVSEYSQTLLDIFKTGKLGIIANFTNRRSFMKDYENLGFLSVNNTNGLIGLINNIAENTENYTLIQSEVSNRYNEKINNYFSK